MMSSSTYKIRLPDGRVITATRHKVSVLDLAALAVFTGDRARWPDILFPHVAPSNPRLVFPSADAQPERGPGHLLSYEGLIDRVGLVDEDLRRVVIGAGNAASATAEDSRAFGNVLEAALAEQARRRGAQ